MSELLPIQLAEDHEEVYSSVLQDNNAIESASLLMQRHLNGSFLLYGDIESTLRTNAHEIIRRYYCQHQQETKCTCANCFRLQNGNLQDVWETTVDEVMKIQTSRELKTLLDTMVAGTNKRIILLNQLNKITTEAANALLKIIEEPPEDTWIIATASSRFSLLPTLQSRLLPIRVKVDNFAQWLIHAENDEVLARFWNNSLGDCAYYENILNTENAQLINLLARNSNPRHKIKLLELQKLIRNAAKNVEDIPKSLESGAILWERAFFSAKSSINKSSGPEIQFDVAHRMPYNIEVPEIDDCNVLLDLCQQLLHAADAIRKNCNLSLVLEKWVLDARLVRRVGSS